VGTKVSIVSPLPQTTYHGVRGILTLPDAQIIFTDTPGFRSFHTSMRTLLNRVADRHRADADLTLWVFDCTDPQMERKFEKLRSRIQEGKRNFLVLNKVDRIVKLKLLPKIDVFFQTGLFAEIIPISARKKDGLDRLLQSVKHSLSSGEMLFPAEMKTDRDEAFLVTEAVREQAYRHLRQELPYRIRVEIEHVQPIANGNEYHAKIHVDTPSRKAIVIGKHAALLKSIGMQARASLSKRLGKKVSLWLTVDVDKDWLENQRLVRSYLEL
jgi:GTP-binding protein Era